MKVKIKNPKDAVAYTYIGKTETYCVNCKKKNVNKIFSFSRTKQNRLLPVSNCALCSKKKPRFINN